VCKVIIVMNSNPFRSSLIPSGFILTSGLTGDRRGGPPVLGPFTYAQYTTAGSYPVTVATCCATFHDTRIVQVPVQSIPTPEPATGSRTDWDGVVGVGDAKANAQRTATHPSPTWRAFLASHARDIVAVDFFLVPTLTYRLLFAFVVLRHHRRELLHLHVTDRPTAVWTARQILEAFPNETAPRYLLRDRDAIYGERVTRCLANMGIREVLIAPRAPWQNPFVERVIGSIRHECLDQVLILNAAHLRRLLRAYVAYYNTARPHQSLDHNSPQPREVHRPRARARGVHPAGRWTPSPLPAGGLIAVGHPAHAHSFPSPPSTAARGGMTRRTLARQRPCVAIPIAVAPADTTHTSHHASEDRTDQSEKVFDRDRGTPQKSANFASFRHRIAAADFHHGLLGPPHARIPGTRREG
jgi:transposase InsO family protein